MIALDSSALIAILNHEPERASLFQAIDRADRCVLSAVTYQEAGQVMFARRGDEGLRKLDELLAIIGADILSYDEAISRRAINAFKRYGKGIHPGARLNFCDCAAYALSKALDAPLLFKGNDFAATDVVPCPMPDAP